MTRRLVQIALALLAAAIPCESALAEIVVAVAAPLSGAHRETGDGVRRAAQRAADAINAAGGLLGERVNLVVEDDGCESARAADVAKALVFRKPAVVVGHTCAGAAVAAAPIYAAANILFIAPGVRHPVLTEKRAGPTIFRLAGRDDRQGEAAAQWLARMAPNGRIGLIHDRTGYARAIAEDAEKSLKKARLSPLPMLTLVAGQKDYDAIARRLKEAGAEAAFFAGYPAEARVIVAGLKREGVPVRFLGSDSLATPEFADTANGESANIRVLVAHEPGVPGPEADSSLATLTTGAVEAWAYGARQANSLEAKAVGAVLAGGAINTSALNTSALGPISFDENGDARIASFAPAFWNGAIWEPRD